MDTLSFAWQFFLRFIFATPAADVILIASAAIAVWATVAVAYVYLTPEPYPLFFGVPARRAHWYNQKFPWKWLAFPCLAAGVFLFAVWPAHAQPVYQEKLPTDTKPGDDVAAAPPDLDKHITPLLAEIAKFQTAWYDQRGFFGQVKPLFANTPADGVAALPDKLLDLPTNGATGSDLWGYLKLDALPYNIRIDVYNGPLGKGFTITVEAKFINQLWMQSVNYGPENWRTTGWLPVSSEEGGR